MKAAAFLLYGAWRVPGSLEKLIGLLPEAEAAEVRRIAQEFGTPPTPETARMRLAEMLQQKRQSRQNRIIELFGRNAVRMEPRMADLMVRLSESRP
jgi:hypothetical protein